MKMRCALVVKVCTYDDVLRQLYAHFCQQMLSGSLLERMAFHFRGRKKGHYLPARSKS